MKPNRMKSSVQTRDDIVVLQFAGTLGYEDRDFELMMEVEEAVEEKLIRGNTRLVVDLSKARAAYGSSVGLLFGTIFKLLERHPSTVVLVASQLDEDPLSTEGPEREPSLLTVEGLELINMNEVFEIFSTVDEAIQFFHSDPPDTARGR